MVGGSTLVAKVEEALQHRTRTIDFTLSAINGHARVLCIYIDHEAARPLARSAAVAVSLRTYYIKGCTPIQYIQLQKLLYRLHERSSHGAIRVGLGIRPIPGCADRLILYRT